METKPVSTLAFASAPVASPTTVPTTLTVTPFPTIASLPSPTFSTVYVQGFEPVSSTIKGYSVVLVPEGDLKIGQESVFVPAFWIGKFEVTNSQYATFLNSNGLNCRGGSNCIDYDSAHVQIGRSGSEWIALREMGGHPVVEISWFGAFDFCDRLGGRLPNVGEWYKAAGWHPATTAVVTYPWGEYLPIPELANYGRLYGDTTAVGSFPNGRSPVGAYDMSGNVWEYVAQIDKNSTNRHWYGGGWDSDLSQIDIFESRQGNGNTTDLNLGFRCAFDVVP